MAKSATIKSGSSKKAVKDQVKSILGSHAKNNDSDSSSSSSESESESDGESTLMKQISTPKKPTKTELPSRLKKENATDSAKKRVSISDTPLGDSKSTPGSAIKPTKSSLKSESFQFKSNEAVDSSDESSSDSSSDSDSSSESEVESKKAVAKPTPMKKKAEPKKTAPPPQPAAPAKSATTIDTSSSESEEESDVEMGDADQEPIISNEISEKDLKAAGAPPETLNSDFMLRKAVGNSDGEKLARLFSEAASSGKQLWYFTAPADVPVTLVESMEIPLDQALSGSEATFMHQGEDFAVEVDQVASNRNIALMIPGGPKDDNYKCNVRRADTVFNLRRVAPTSAISNITITATKKTYRAQPRGMKMRFRPIGVPADAEMGRMTFDDSDDESMAPPSPKKRKHKEATADDQSKKKRKDKTGAESKKEKKGKKEKKSKDQVLPPRHVALSTPREFTNSSDLTPSPAAIYPSTPQNQATQPLKAHKATTCDSSERTPSYDILTKAQAAQITRQAPKTKPKVTDTQSSQDQKSVPNTKAKQLKSEDLPLTPQKARGKRNKKTDKDSSSTPGLSQLANMTATAAGNNTTTPSIPSWSNINSNQPLSTAPLNTRHSLQTPVPAPVVPATTAPNSATPGRLVSESPVPVPVFGKRMKETPVPLPNIPGLVVPGTTADATTAAATAGVAATPTPKEKTSRKKKDSKGAVSTPAGRNNSGGVSNMTPVPPPRIPGL
ncbi:hypothetical protein BROUX41_003193 [Berkeleyomyces rouxiae]|uniref:uncharacterized protein n=1 Tax=Berkeleyomyces rouxiae TaxID=2035830 RepID=UPI003B808F25